MKTWTERIDDAKRVGRFTREDRDLARNWVTCACGEQDKSLLGHNHEPIDYDLLDFGSEFYDYVVSDVISAARECLAKIQARACELLAEQATA